MLPGLLRAVFSGTEGGPAGGLPKAVAVSFGGVLSEAVACRYSHTCMAIQHLLKPLLHDSCPQSDAMIRGFAWLPGSRAI